MKILTLNAGSSSVKFALFEAGQDAAIREGQISWANGDRQHACLTVCLRNGKQELAEVAVRDDAAAATCAIRAALGSASSREATVAAVGHRIVHGGIQFRDSVLIDAKVKAAIVGLGKLAPLHNPPALEAVAAAEAVFPELPQVAVFDTSFYKDLPPKAFIYPLPYHYYQQWGIRRFGFHGTSYSYCTRRATEMMNSRSTALNLVICHLGGGCSATAVRGGAAMATTSGFSPLDGLMMGTRPGSLDPGILLALQSEHALTVEQMGAALNSASGLLGVSGISSDAAELEQAAAKGDERAGLAIEMFADRVRAAIGGLAVTLGCVDALVFTDRVGETSPALRARICDGLKILGLRLDPRLNQNAQPDADIATPDSPARILVVHTREELMIARETAAVLAQQRGA